MFVPARLAIQNAHCVNDSLHTVGNAICAVSSGCPGVFAVFETFLPACSAGLSGYRCGQVVLDLAKCLCHLLRVRVFARKQTQNPRRTMQRGFCLSKRYYFLWPGRPVFNPLVHAHIAARRGDFYRYAAAVQGAFHAVVFQAALEVLHRNVHLVARQVQVHAFVHRHFDVDVAATR